MPEKLELKKKTMLDNAEQNKEEQNETVQNQTVQGQTVQGQTVQGQTVQGQTVQGQTVQSVLSPAHREALQRFILFWGEMASRWGINRTMAQIHALLYASESPLDTDEIMELLQISRGNANMNLRSLINWDLVRKVHQSGSRKDYYTAEKDVWKITTRVVKEREKRELQPVKQQLIDCRQILNGEEGAALRNLSDEEKQFSERIGNLIDLMEIFEGFSKSLLPFVQGRGLDEAKQLFELARRFTSDENSG